MTYTTTTNLFSDYKLPTPEARFDFAKFREQVTNKTTRDLYFIFTANRDAVDRYKNGANTQLAACTAAARRDFAAALLNTRGMRFDYTENDFYRF